MGIMTRRSWRRHHGKNELAIAEIENERILVLLLRVKCSGLRKGGEKNHKMIRFGPPNRNGELNIIE